MVAHTTANNHMHGHAHNYLLLMLNVKRARRNSKGQTQNWCPARRIVCYFVVCVLLVNTHATSRSLCSARGFLVGMRLILVLLPPLLHHTEIRLRIKIKSWSSEDAFCYSAGDISAYSYGLSEIRAGQFMFIQQCQLETTRLLCFAFHSQTLL